MRVVCLCLGLLLWTVVHPARAEIKGDYITLGEFGADELAFLALPTSAPKAAILLIPDAYGSRVVMEQRCLLMARLGFLVLSLDLYTGQTAQDARSADLLQQRIKPEKAAEAIRAALRLLRESPRYQSGSIMIAVWGPHLKSLTTATMKDASADRIRSWVLLDPASPREIPQPLRHGPWTFFVRRAVCPKSLEAEWRAVLPKDLPEGQFQVVEADPGFLLDPGDSTASVQTWSQLIERWNQQAVVAQETPATAKQDPIEASPRKSILTRPTR